MAHSNASARCVWVKSNFARLTCFACGKQCLYSRFEAADGLLFLSEPRECCNQYAQTRKSTQELILQHVCVACSLKKQLQEAAVKEAAAAAGKEGGRRNRKALVTPLAPPASIGGTLPGAHQDLHSHCLHPLWCMVMEQCSTC